MMKFCVILLVLSFDVLTSHPMIVRRKFNEARPVNPFFLLIFAHAKLKKIHGKMKNVQKQSRFVIPDYYLPNIRSSLRLG